MPYVFRLDKFFEQLQKHSTKNKGSKLEGEIHLLAYRNNKPGLITILHSSLYKEF